MSFPRLVQTILCLIVISVSVEELRRTVTFIIAQSNGGEAIMRFNKITAIGTMILLAPWIVLAFFGASPLFYFLLGVFVGVYGLAISLVVSLFRMKKKLEKKMKELRETLAHELTHGAKEEKERTQPGLV